jgi:REP element-mobilizing transposase RayT
MRFPRVKAEGQSFYHCISRVVDRRCIFQTTGYGSPKAERFVLLMRRLEAFTGVRVLTYTLMSNHFHLISLSVLSKPHSPRRQSKNALHYLRLKLGKTNCDLGKHAK